MIRRIATPGPIQGCLWNDTARWQAYMFRYLELHVSTWFRFGWNVSLIDILPVSLDLYCKYVHTCDSSIDFLVFQFYVRIFIYMVSI